MGFELGEELAALLATQDPEPTIGAGGDYEPRRPENKIVEKTFEAQAEIPPVLAETLNRFGGPKSKRLAELDAVVCNLTGEDALTPELLKRWLNERKELADRDPTFQNWDLPTTRPGQSSSSLRNSADYMAGKYRRQGLYG